MNTDQYSLSRHSTNKTVKIVPIFKKVKIMTGIITVQFLFSVTLSKMLEKVVPKTAGPSGPPQYSEFASDVLFFHLLW